MIIADNTIIYVACPSNVATGGPELLHQLVYKLNRLGMKALMYYYDFCGIGSPVHKEYEIYNNKYTTMIKDSFENILVVPEIATHLLYRYNKIQKIIWWLSVDNYYIATNDVCFFMKNFNFIVAAKTFLNNLSIPSKEKFYKFDDSQVVHFVQSEYAKQHLLSKNVENEKIYYLSDYINPKFFENEGTTNSEKENIVVYNPKKGFEFTRKIIKKARDITFVPIQNMSRDEVISLLRKAKVYIDFGNHPGKDRIPREAAISGCCVIVGKKGAANYFEDVPIDEEFKFIISTREIPKIIKKIKDCLINYSEEYRKFTQYREWIKKEEEIFDNNLKGIFKC